MKTYELNCTYGSQQTPDTMYVCEQSNGLKWYTIDGSVNVNATYEDLHDGIDSELVSDVDCFTWSSRINSLEELETAVNA